LVASLKKHGRYAFIGQPGSTTREVSRNLVQSVITQLKNDSEFKGKSIEIDGAEFTGAISITTDTPFTIHLTNFTSNRRSQFRMRGLRVRSSLMTQSLTVPYS
jgi:hypothetical protein